MKTYKIAVAGTGYVGLSLSVLLAQHNQVMAVDIVQAKVDMINNHKFLFFKNIKIGYNKIINTIAASTFGVLLIHANSNTMRRWLWQDTFNNVGAYESGNVVIHAVVSVILIYAVCMVIDICRIKLLENPLIKKLK